MCVGWHDFRLHKGREREREGREASTRPSISILQEAFFTFSIVGVEMKSKQKEEEEREKRERRERERKRNSSA